jgi:hypothetical protein
VNAFLRIGILVSVFAAIAAPGSIAAEPTYGSRVVDPLNKVFAETDLKSFSGDYFPEVARGEYATWLVLIRKPVALSNVSVEVTEPSDGHSTLPKPRVRFVGTVQVSTQAEKRPGPDALRPASGMFPDPLYPTAPESIAAGDLLQLWVDVKIPTDAGAGKYQSKLVVHASGDPAQEIPLQLRVYAVTVGKANFWISQSLYLPNIILPTTPAGTLDAYFAKVKTYAEDLVSHGQHMLEINPLQMIRPGPDGSYDYSFFDRYVQVLKDAGCGDRIQGCYLGTRSAGWVSDFDAQIGVPKDGLFQVQKVPIDSDAAKTFFASYLPALVAHLKEKGWLGSYLQSIADEPIPENVESWKRLKAYADRYEPGIPTVDAEPPEMIGDLCSINCPCLNSLDTSYTKWEPILHAPGREFWYYVANQTLDNYANRFIDQPSMKTRLIPWIAFGCGARGFLHWGYDSWYVTKDPFHDLTPQGLPPGDGWIVYPGANGPIDSIRWEQLRDGVGDYELLGKAMAKDYGAAVQTIKQVVKTFSVYDTSIENFRKVRHELLEMDVR